MKYKNVLIAIIAVVIWAGGAGTVRAQGYECTSWGAYWYTGSGSGQSASGFQGPACGTGSFSCNVGGAVNWAVPCHSEQGSCYVGAGAGDCDWVTLTNGDIAGVAGYSCAPGDWHSGNGGIDGTMPGPGGGDGGGQGGCVDCNDADDPLDYDNDPHCVSVCALPADAGFENDPAGTWNTGGGATIAESFAQLPTSGSVSQPVNTEYYARASAIITGSGVLSITLGSDTYTVTVTPAQFFYVSCMFPPDPAERTFSLTAAAGAMDIDWVCLSEYETACLFDCPAWGNLDSAAGWALENVTFKPGLAEIASEGWMARELEIFFPAALGMMVTDGELLKVQWGDFTEVITIADCANAYAVFLPLTTTVQTLTLSVPADADSAELDWLCVIPLPDGCLNPGGMLHSLDHWETGGNVEAGCTSVITMYALSTISQTFDLAAGDYMRRLRYKANNSFDLLLTPGSPQMRRTYSSDWIVFDVPFTHDGGECAVSLAEYDWSGSLGPSDYVNLDYL